MEEKEIKWRVTRGAFSLGRHQPSYKRGDEFMATPSQVPEAFRDVVVPVGGKIALFEPEPVDTVTIFEAVHRSGGWYDVVDKATDKVISEQALRKEDAEAMVADLMGEGE